MNNRNTNDKSEIDLLHLVKLLWSKAWLIVLVMILLGALAFSYAMFFVTPMYQATAKMYVNNKSISVGSSVLSISDISAAKELLNTYVEILHTRETLEVVIENTGVEYTYEQLSRMISASSVNDTEIFAITVTGPDPKEAKDIVDEIVKILPDRITNVITDTQPRLVDKAVTPVNRSSPSYTRYAVIGMLVGFVLTCGIIIIIDLMDTTMRSEDYLTQNYPEIPVLAIVPDMYETKKRSYSYYYSYGGSKESGK
ncbi:MAG: hypothetical protein IJD17_05470 [Clostridia bacterium]|nr:hypothetical protein [Clostridia bacterium]